MSNLSFIEEIDSISEEAKNMAEEAIKNKQKSSDFDIREFPTELIVDKYTKKIPEIDNKTELFMPDYQREFKWSLKQQSEFIESVITDLPIPYIYVADVADGDNEGRIEIIDGSQRIRTIARFINNMFALEGLTLVPQLNGFKFKDLKGSRQLRFKRKTIRFIELIGVDEEARRQIFYRLNSGGVILNPMEIRFGTNDGDFLLFLKKLANDDKFKRLCPISAGRVKNREYEEMLLRFFAYRFDMDSYVKEVRSFLTDFMAKMNNKYVYKEDDNKVIFDEEVFRKAFDDMLNFVDINFAPIYFKKNIKNASVPRIRFEALSVGVSLALETGQQIQYDSILSWLTSETFSILTDSDASNSIPKLKDRTFFVVNKLLGKDWTATSTAFIKALSGKSEIPFLEQGPDEEEVGKNGDQYVLF
ncbi:DUF262 domain-containing protein [Acinetobacter radioresistens]|uniref:DUF262 domain-containing protein n=1 Tax=Acinetobacter radioresistens TaxID=40216 RepID=UPI000E727325|nr:DUF262 domain-containing protein [Acinetobacter radioresistens]RJL73016.1 DUF262 domain-containing protein [Acinetobacter radioresistens]